MDSTIDPSSVPIQPRRAPLIAAILTGVVLGGFCATIAEVISVGAGANRHVVLPGRIYRSAQPDTADLRGMVEREGIRTVLNLRGLCLGFDWFEEEARATHDLGICQEDITLSAKRLPPPQELRRLIEVLDRTEYPVLLHCRRGSDRTGLVAALALLLYSDADLETALQQCSARYGHFRMLDTERMDEFFDSYKSWLVSRGEAHQPQRFRHWVLNEYTPGPALADLEQIDARDYYRPGEAPAIQVRAWNRSGETWQFRPGTCVGVHARYLLFAPWGPALADERAGFFEAQVRPGESIDLVLALPVLKIPGRYRMLIDLVGPRHLSFMQMGSQPLELELDVRE